MKILMVSRRFPPDVRSGTETVFASLWAEARKGHDVRLLVGYRGSPEGFPPEAVAVDLRRGVAHLTMLRAAQAEVARFRPDVVLSNSVEVVPRGAPTALLVHDLNFGKAERDAGTFLREQLYRLQGRRVAQVIAVSDATREALRPLGIDAVTIHNGVDVARFVPREAPPSDVVRFAYPARILPGKGQHALLDAVGRMRPDQRRRVRVTIVGAVADRLYADRLRILAYEQPVDILEDVPDIVPFYQDADVIVFPSLMTEGFGFTAVEGMACGKPVIFYDQPAVREATGGLAVPVPRDDPGALRDAMLKLAADPAERARLGRAGRAYVEARSWGKVWARYEEVLVRISRA
ncbi:MAG: glycosyltransferase family 4 protein [Myxococcota bacterium]